MKKKHFFEMSLREYVDHLVYDHLIDNPEDSVISEGVCPIDFTLMSISDECDYKKFAERIKNVLSNKKANLHHFEGNGHKKIFGSKIQSCNCTDYSYLAALYLLSSNENLWATVKEHIRPIDILFDEIKRIPMGSNYVILKAAQVLLYGTDQLTMGDLVNPEVIDKKTFLLICKALAICIYGVAAVGIEVYDLGEKGVMIGDNF